MLGSLFGALFGALPLAREVALLSPEGQALLTFEQLEERALGFGALLREPQRCGISQGSAPLENLALLSRNRSEFLEVVLGSIAGGAWLTPLNWHLSTAEIAYILEDSGSTLVVVDPELESLLPEGTPRLRLGSDYEAALTRGIDLFRARPLASDGSPGGTRIYTSGTSGRPKGVERQRASTLDAAWEGLRTAGRALGLDGLRPDGASHVHLITGPMYHAAPLMFAIYDLLNGARVCILPRFSERDFTESVARLRVSHTHVVPTMCVRLLRLGEDERRSFDASSLSLVLHGAAPISPGVKRRMIEWWGPLLLEYWGATEGGVYTLIDSEEWLRHPGSVGRPLPKFEVFAVDEAGERLGPGQTGTLYCRHRELPRPFIYHRAESKTRACYLEPHVFTAGDLGHVDAEGYVFLSARRSNLILSGGVNIYPAEVEAELLESPWVADVAVYGAPDAEWGERVCAAIELSPEGRTERERGGDAAFSARLLASLEDRLARYKWPRRLHFVAQLPRLPTGKVRHEALRALEASASTNGD